MSLSLGLDIAMRALMAQQAAVDTNSHNVANATTAGYSRQRVRMQAVPGVSTYSVGSPGGAGGGVEMLPVQRVRDIFIDSQMRSAMQDQGRFDARASSLQRVELALNEPGDNGLRATLDRFFNAWRDLANSPDSTAARTALVQAGNSVGVTANRLQTSLVQLRDEANTGIQQDITQINGLSKQVADLNEQIARLQVSNNEGSDLRDRRDTALDQLSKLADTQQFERADGRVDVSLGGHMLVSGGRTEDLTGVPNVLNNNYVDLQFASDGAPATVNSGELRGLLDQRDGDLTARIADLNALVGGVITDVNTAHAAGFGLDGVNGRAFFSGTDASNIAVSAVVLADPNAVAASTTLAGIPGNGDNASVISDLQYARGLLGGTATYDEYWASFVAGVGSASAQQQMLQTSQNDIVQHIDQLRQGTSGVNLDEELVDLMGHQRAYQAAARLVTTLDSMLDTLINRR
jgi:flagellar hook-associated protein 1 FlgK